MNETPVFSTQLFQRICQTVVDHGYEAIRFDQKPAAGRTFYLRHDVDISPRNALRLGEISSAVGLRANYFFQLNAETYQLLDAANLRIVVALRAMGHLVGLHIDQALSGDDEGKIASTISWFNDCVTPIDRCVSFHRPTPSVLSRRYGSFLNAYAPEYFLAETYLSDSRRSLTFLDRFDTLLAAGPSIVQLLLHPEWWSSLEDVPAVWSALQSRRAYELRRYMAMNFTKVFADVETIEDRDFGI